MSLSHEIVTIQPIQSHNTLWVSGRQNLFYISLVIALLDIIVGNTCGEIGPIRRFIFWIGLLCPIITCLYVGHSALRKLGRAVAEIEYLESGARGAIIVQKSFTLTK